MFLQKKKHKTDTGIKNTRKIDKGRGPFEKETLDPLQECRRTAVLDRSLSQRGQDIKKKQDKWPESRLTFGQDLRLLPRLRKRRQQGQ